MPLRFYNTASRQLEVFEPLTPGMVRLYCCGPTVYHYAHLGNLRTAVFEDLLRRVLEFNGYEVRHVVNITDVGHLTSDGDTGEDKMEKGARREGKSAWDIAEYYTETFWKDWKALNLLWPGEWPRATAHIPEQIDLIRTLENKGFTYAIAGDGIYFDTARFPRYPDFAHLDVEGLQAGARVSMAEGKRNPTDFALWKFSPTDAQRAMEWDSPWGRGFPGWHIECSAMAMKLLGETLDIHCGGSDLVRVHHTNEIAQSECATGKPFVRYWLHGGWLLEASDEDDGGGGKMSKSSGEFVTLDALIQRGYGAMDYRYLCLTAHYRNYLRFSTDAMDSARDSLRNLRKKTDPLIGKSAPVRSDRGLEWRARFLEAVNADLNLPQALGVVNLMLKDPDLLDGERAALIDEFDRVLGLRLDQPSPPATAEVLPEDLTALLEERRAARLRKDWARSDAIRDQFRARGYALKDNPDGTAGWSAL